MITPSSSKTDSGPGEGIATIDYKSFKKERRKNKPENEAANTTAIGLFESNYVLTPTSYHVE